MSRRYIRRVGLLIPGLLKRIEAQRPRYIMVNIRRGTQEPLGFYLRQNLSYRPSIICVGAAIAFITGMQAAIPVWADTPDAGLVPALPACAGENSVPRIWKGLRLATIMRQISRAERNQLNPRHVLRSDHHCGIPRAKNPIRSA